MEGSLHKIMSFMAFFFIFLNKTRHAKTSTQLVTY